jgi:hypothetical protein
MIPNHDITVKQYTLNHLIKESSDNQDLLWNNLNKKFEVIADIDEYYYAYKKIILPYMRTFQRKEFVADNETLCELNLAIDNFIKEREDYLQLTSYITKVLNEADGLATVKECIPEHLHKHLTLAFYFGDKLANDLKVDKYYEMLEEAPLKNVILRG